MAFTKGLFLALFMGIFWLTLLPEPVEAVNSNSFTWSIIPAGNLDMRLWSNRCMSATGSQDLNVTVYRRPGSSVSTSASVTGTIYKPLGGSDPVSFTGQGDGNYSKTYSFSQSGTYKLVMHATDVNYTAGDLNEYIYVQDFDFDILFSNNSFSVTAGNTGTVQNYVQNSDDNAVTGLTGSIDINYPGGASFVNDGTISETGNGNYYYNFTAPNTNGVYTAASSFTCGPNTDVNGAGRFTVSGASSGGGDDGDGETGSGGSGGGSGGGGAGGGASAPDPFGPWNQTFTVEPGALASGEPYVLSVQERVKFTLDGKIHHLGVRSLGINTAEIVVSSTPQLAILNVGEVIPFELSGDSFFDLEVTLKRIVNGKAEFVLKSIHEAIQPFDAHVAGWSFAEPIEVGTANRLKLILRNTGTSGTAILVKATISQGEENEYFDTMLTPFIGPRETIEIQLDEPYTTYQSGNHLLRVQLFTPDGGEKIGEYAKNFDIGGLLRYDVVATCLDSSVVPGKEISAQINLINMGDYFQDMQFSWWVEGADAKKIGEGTFPIALYSDESRSLVRSVLIPPETPAGEYKFRTQLAYETTLIEGFCSFAVQTNKEYYSERLAYNTTVLAQLNELVQKRTNLAPEILEKLDELQITMALFEDAIEREDFVTAEELRLQIRDALVLLSKQIINQEPKGFLERINFEQLAVTVVSIVIVVGGMLLMRGSRLPGKEIKGNSRETEEKDFLLELLQRHGGRTAPKPAPPERNLSAIVSGSFVHELPAHDERGIHPVGSLTELNSPHPEKTGILAHLKSDIHAEMEKELTLLHRILGVGKPKTGEKRNAQ